jgi:LmbE family N-acetylglucosaminyl deacetylase
VKILLLSPHRDDAAFSLALSISHWLNAGHTVTILTVFTRSLYAPYSDAEFVHENDRLSYVSAMRLREDQLFLQRMTQNLSRSRKANVQMIDLNLKDAPIRLRTPLDQLCDTPVNPEDPAIEKIRKALGRQSESGNLEALILPLALGHHVDHLTVRAAASPLAATLPAAFYEDLPYAATHSVAAADLEGLQAGTYLPDLQSSQPLTPVFCRSAPAEAAVELKRHLAAGYASQIDDETANTISAFAANYSAAERLWANPSWQIIADTNDLSTPS